MAKAKIFVYLDKKNNRYLEAEEYAAKRFGWEGHFMWQDDWKTHSKEGTVSREIGDQLREKYESRFFPLGEKYKIETHDKFLSSYSSSLRGSGWSVDFYRIEEYLTGKLAGYEVCIRVDSNRGYNLSRVYWNKKFFAPTSYKMKQNLVTQMWATFAPLDMISGSAAEIQQMLDNRPEFGVRPVVPWIDEDLVKEVYRIQGEIVLALLGDWK